MRRIDLIVGAFAVIFGIVAFQQSMNYLFYGTTPGPGFLPRVMATAIAVIGVLLLATRLIGDPHRFGVAPELKKSEILRTSSVAGVITAGVVLIPILGFFIGMLLLVAGLLLGVERMRNWPAVITTVLLPVILVWLFGNVLGVRLPTGIFGF